MIATPGVENLEWADLAAKNDIDAAENQVKLPFGKFPNFAGEQSTVESDELRDVSNRVFGKSGRLRSKKDIARSVDPSQIAGQGNTNHGPDPAPVQGVSLDYEDRPAKSGARTRGLRQICPVDVALRDYHSMRLSVRLDAADRPGSGRVSTVLHTSFMASVIASGSWRARYSSTASTYSRLRDFLRRREKRSASAYSLSGIEMAVFIPGV
jgi:hypothetical protein